jgi:hypothetical protein
MRLQILTFLIVAWLPAVASAQAWVAKLFSEREHNFGTVARGAEAVHRFEVKNIFKQDVELLSVRSSCGCTTPTIERKVLKTGDVGYVTATFNTRTFTGYHGATLTVEVRWDDNGMWRHAETQLRVNGHIRGDVVFQPGSVNFETVAQGDVSEQRVEVSYAGRSDWRIVDVRGASEDLEVELAPKQRYSGRVAYDLIVRLKESAPAGYFNEQLVIVTSDSQNPRIPIHISGRVVPAVSVAPETLLLGEVSRGDQVSKRVLVRGHQPFRIVAVHCDDEQSFEFKVDDRPGERHFVEVVFHANQELGAVKQTIHIATDLGEQYQATLTAYATVVAGESAPSEPAASKLQNQAGSASAAGTTTGRIATQ